MPLTFALAGTFKAIQKGQEKTGRAQLARWNAERRLVVRWRAVKTLPSPPGRTVSV